MKKGSIKNTRINAEVRKEIQSVVMNGIKDPRISPMTSITDARVTADLKYCTVYVSVLGNDEEMAQTLEGLKSATGFIRRELARTVNLRLTPELRFVPDRSMAYGAHIDSLLDDMKKSGQMGNEEENAGEAGNSTEEERAGAEGSGAGNTEADR